MRGGPVDLAVLGLSGREQLRAMQQGLVRAPANARLTGRRLTEVTGRSVTFTLPASEWLAGPKGTIHPGALVLLADSALTGAVLTGLPSGVVFTTSELSVSFLGPMPLPGGELAARAELLHCDGRLALTTAKLLGPKGDLLGFGSSRVFLQPPMAIPPPQPRPPPEPEWEAPDPWKRPCRRPASPPTGELTGLQLLAETAAGLRTRPPVDRLLGIRLTDAQEGETTFTMPATAWLGNEMGTVSGGALGLLAVSASSAAGQSVARPDSSYRALDLKINFLRPVYPDGEPLVATGRALHRGRLMLASTEIEHSGELVAVATGSTVLGL